MRLSTRRALQALMLALLARKWRPRECLIRDRDDLARADVQNYIAQFDFKRFLEEAAADEPGVSARETVPVAILKPERMKTIGIEDRVLRLRAGDDRTGARHIWREHGPGSGRGGWQRLSPADWRLAQEIVDRFEPVRQPDGRWRFISDVRVRGRGRSRRDVRYVLVTEVIGDRLMPVTFYPVRALNERRKK